jgi:hypothetical protein
MTTTPTPAERLATLIERANRARWMWLTTGNDAYRRIADAAMDQLREGSGDET